MRPLSGSIRFRARHSGGIAMRRSALSSSSPMQAHEGPVEVHQAAGAVAHHAQGFRNWPVGANARCSPDPRQRMRAGDANRNVSD